MSYEQVFKEASEKLPRERIVRCACDCALINIDLIKPYTEKFELIKNFLANPIRDPLFAYPARADINSVAAADAARDATRNATDAWSAAYAAWAAASASSNAAADAYAAYAAVTAVSDAARISEESKQKVDKLVKDMMKEVG